MYFISNAWKTHWHTNIWIAEFQQKKLKEWLLPKQDKNGLTHSLNSWKLQQLKQTLHPPQLRQNINHISVDMHRSWACFRPGWVTMWTVGWNINESNSGMPTMQIQTWIKLPQVAYKASLTARVYFFFQSTEEPLVVKVQSFQTYFSGEDTLHYTAILLGKFMPCS